MNAFVVAGAETQEAATAALETLLTGSHCSWPDQPSRFFVDYVLVEAIRTGIVAFDEALA